MKTTTLLSIVVLVVFCSACDRTASKKAGSTKTDLPEALKDDDYSLKKMSRDASLVQAIYADQVTKQPTLQKLEEQQQHFYDGKPDSLEAFNKYAQTNSRYYDSAKEALQTMKDTVLRDRLRAILAESKRKYDAKSSRFTALIKNIDNTQLVFNDYYLALKVAVSLPVIENYQDKNQPGIKSIAAVDKEAQKLKDQTIKLAGQYGGKTNEKK